MILPLAFLIGFLLGFRQASKKKGNYLDKLQYGSAFGIGFLLLALIIMILLQRLELF